MAAQTQAYYVSQTSAKQISDGNAKLSSTKKPALSSYPNIYGSTKIFSTLGYYLSVALMTTATAVFAATMRGDWLMFFVHYWKQNEPSDPTEPADRNASLTSHIVNHVPLFQDAWMYSLASVGVSYVTFFGIGGFLQCYFYIRQKQNPEDWKCQPTKWLSSKDEISEIMLGSLNMTIGGTLSGFITAYLINGGSTTLYWSMHEMGLPWLIISTVLTFIYLDAGAYYIHRALHFPPIYKNIHKWHHKYTAPTAFSTTALHPLEFLWLQGLMITPIFFIKIYSGAYIGIVLYSYYYGMMDHSGIKMEAVWPWQPNTYFHDDHHKYFHVNFGFNMKLWDWLHDTLRKTTRTYGEDVFWGKGKEVHKQQ